MSNTSLYICTTSELFNFLINNIKWLFSKAIETPVSKVLLFWVYQSKTIISCSFSSVQSLSRVQLFATPWITARQASITNSRSSLRLMSIKSVMPSSHLILCHPLLLLHPTLPASESFLMSQLFAWGGQSIGVPALASVLPMNTQDWSPLGMYMLYALKMESSSLGWSIRN